MTYAENMARGQFIGSAEAAQVTRPSPLISGLASLHGELECLQSKILRLSTRLEPLLAPSMPVPCDGKEPPKPPICEAIARVYEANQKIGALQTLVDDIFERVQV